LFATLLLAAGCAQTGMSAPEPMMADADVPALMRAKGCHACHAMSDTLLGPSYQAIATMHGRNAEVMTDVLAEKIVLGGAGNWGVVPMIPNDRVSDAEARAMAAWILEQGGG
jgi:cytochrome c